MAEENADNKLLMEALTTLRGSIEALSKNVQKNITETARSSTLGQKKEKDQKELIQDLKDYQKLQREGKLTTKGANEELERLAKRYKDSGLKIEEFDRGLKEAAKETGNFKLGMSDAASEFLRAGKGIAAGAGQYTKELLAAQQSAKPLDAAQKMSTAGLNAFSSSATGAGQMMTSMAKNPWAKAAGIGLQILGAGAKVASEALNTIGPIIIGFQDTYTKANAAGATFAGGMTELRNIAGEAGMKMEDLVGGVEKGQEAFLRGGANFTQASKIIAGTNKALTEGKAATELFALGFTDVKDRVALAGAAFEQARSRGMSFSDAQKNITDLTLTYGKDLKILQGITGKNAQKELEKANLETQRGALMNKLDEKQKNAYQGAFTTLGALGPQADKARAALTQLASGGEITDPDILINEPMKKMLEEMAAQIKQGTNSIGEGGKKAGNILGKAAEDAKGPAGEMGRSLDKAAVQLGKNANGIVAGGSQMYNALVAVKIPKNIGEDAADAVDGLTNNMDPTTKTMADLDSSARKVQVSLEQISTGNGSIKLFAGAMTEATDATKKLVDFIGKATGGGSAGGIASGLGAGLLLDQAGNLASMYGAFKQSGLGKGNTGGGGSGGGGGPVQGPDGRWRENGRFVRAPTTPTPPAGGGSRLGRLFNSAKGLGSIGSNLISGLLGGGSGGAGGMFTGLKATMSGLLGGAGSGATSLLGKVGGMFSGLGSGASATTGMLGRLGTGALTVGKGLLGGGGIAGIGGLAAQYGGDKLKDAGYKKTGGALSAAGTAATYAGTGALVGSVVPVVGTAIGAALGGVIGGFKGLYDNWEDITGKTSEKVDAQASEKGGATPIASADSLASTATAMTDMAEQQRDKIIQAAVAAVQNNPQQIESLKLMAEAMGIPMNSTSSAGIADMSASMKQVATLMSDQMDLMRSIANNTKNTATYVS